MTELTALEAQPATLSFFPCVFSGLSFSTVAELSVLFREALELGRESVREGGLLPDSDFRLWVPARLVVREDSSSVESAEDSTRSDLIELMDFLERTELTLATLAALGKI